MIVSSPIIKATVLTSIPDVQSLTSNTNNFDVEPSVLVICLKIFTYHTKHLKIFYFKTNRKLKTNK